MPIDTLTRSVYGTSRIQLDGVLFILFNGQSRLYGLLLRMARARDGMNYNDKEGACVTGKIQSAQIAKYACKNIGA